MKDKKVEKDDKKSKDAKIKIKDKISIDFEPKIEESLLYILDENLDIEDIRNIVEEFLLEVTPLEEALSVASRIKKRNTMRRYRSRIKIARKRAMRKRSSSQKLKKRARRSAVNMVKSRYARGHSLKGLSYAEKGRLENMAKRRKNLITRTARRLVRVKRATETKRLNSR